MNRKKGWILLFALWSACSAQAATVTLDWNAVTTNADGSGITDLSGYRLFYATYSLTSLTTSQAMTRTTVTRLALTSGLTRTLTVADGTTYYFRLTAQDTSGNQSNFSELPDQVSYYAAASAVPGGVLGGAAGLREAYCYPNPAVGADPVIRAMMGGVEEMEVTIYDQSGQTVHTGRSRETRTLNGETGHEYRWSGEKATGVYYAVIHGKKGEETIRARAKFAVVR
jgi:hypothetical protein